MTLEDPVEYEMPGINQVQINPQAGLTFATGLRSFYVRIKHYSRRRNSWQRDDRTSCTGSSDGALGFSTLHTNNASGAIPRLLDLGAWAFSYRVGSLCCRRSAYSTESLSDVQGIVYSEQPLIDQVRLVLEQSPSRILKLYLYRGSGVVNGETCQTCGGSKYQGRIGVFSFSVTDAISRLIFLRAPMSEIEKQAVSEGMITMKQDGYMKAVEGVTSIEEVLR